MQREQQVFSVGQVRVSPEKLWAVTDRPYSLELAAAGALYEAVKKFRGRQIPLLTETFRQFFHSPYERPQFVFEATPQAGR